MKNRAPILIVIAVLLAVGGSVWYGRSKAVAPSMGTAIKIIPSVQSTATSSLATGNSIDIPALEKKLGIKIKEIPPPVSTVDTSNWKTYRNEEYGFEVKYPGEWTNLPITKKGPGFAVDFAFAYPGAEEIGGGVDISSELAHDSLDLLKRILNRNDQLLDSIATFTQSGNIVIQIHRSNIYDGRVSKTDGDYTYILETKNIGVLYLGGNDGTPSDLTIQSIFSTLRFFDPKPSNQ